MAASEDAFDAGCTALVMAAHTDQLAALSRPDGPAADAARREGWVWGPVMS
jgi:hypothetical protein